MKVRLVDADSVQLEPEDALEDALLRRMNDATVKVQEPEPLATNIVTVKLKVKEDPK